MLQAVEVNSRDGVVDGGCVVSIDMGHQHGGTGRLPCDERIGIRINDRAHVPSRNLRTIANLAGRVGDVTRLADIAIEREARGDLRPQVGTRGCCAKLRGQRDLVEIQMGGKKLTIDRKVDERRLDVREEVNSVLLHPDHLALRLRALVELEAKVRPSGHVGDLAEWHPEPLVEDDAGAEGLRENARAVLVPRCPPRISGRGAVDFEINEGKRCGAAVGAAGRQCDIDRDREVCVDGRVPKGVRDHAIEGDAEGQPEIRVRDGSHRPQVVARCRTPTPREKRRRGTRIIRESLEGVPGAPSPAGCIHWQRESECHRPVAHDDRRVR